jgi:hypothetical protein
MPGEKLSLYEQGHLIVSAIRLFSFSEKQLPTAEDISKLTGFPIEITYHLCNRLIETDVLKMVKGAFDDRYSIGDHLKIEELPRAVDEKEMEREIEKFRVERKTKHEKIDKMFDKKEFEKQRKKQLEEMEKKFKSQAEKKKNPFDSPDATDN